MTDYSLNVSDTRVAATYDTHDRVLQAKTIIKRKLGIADKKIKVVAPNDGRTERKLEGRSEKVGNNMLNLHFFYGALGFLIGMLLAFILVESGPSWAQQNPMFTYIALVSPGLFIGLFIAGFMSLKPQHDVINQTVMESQSEAKWTLVIDTEDTSFSRDQVIGEIKQTNVVEVQK